MKAIAATRIFDELPPMDDVLARKVTVLGSTGSIGVNTLDVITHVRKLHGERALPVAALIAGDNVKVLIQQALAVKPGFKLDGKLATSPLADLLREVKHDERQTHSGSASLFSTPPGGRAPRRTDP